MPQRKIEELSVEELRGLLGQSEEAAGRSVLETQPPAPPVVDTTPPTHAPIPQTGSADAPSPSAYAALGGATGIGPYTMLDRAKFLMGEAARSREADVLRGALKGAGSSIYGLGRLIPGISAVHQKRPASLADLITPKSPGHGKPVGLEQIPRFKYEGAIGEALRKLLPEEKPESLVPRGQYQQAGHGLEQFAEYFLPSRVIKGLNLTKARVPKGQVGKAKAIMEALGMGTVAGAQGASLKESGVAAGLGLALPIGAKAGEYITKNTLPRMINSLIGMKPKMLRAGDPGARLAKENVTAGSLESLFLKIQARLLDSGRKLEDKLLREGAGKTINNIDEIVLTPFENAARGPNKGVDEFRNQLSSKFDWIIEQLPASKTLTPLQTHKLKVKLGKEIKWDSPAAYADEMNQVFIEVYRGLNNAIDSAVPGAKVLQKRWGDYWLAKAATEAQRDKKRAAPFISEIGVVPRLLRGSFGATPFKTGSTRLMKGALDPSDPVLLGIPGMVPRAVVAKALSDRTGIPMLRSNVDFEQGQIQREAMEYAEQGLINAEERKQVRDLARTSPNKAREYLDKIVNYLLPTNSQKIEDMDVEELKKLQSPQE